MSGPGTGGPGLHQGVRPPCSPHYMTSPQVPRTAGSPAVGRVPGNGDQPAAGASEHSWCSFCLHDGQAGSDPGSCAQVSPPQPALWTVAVRSGCVGHRPPCKDEAGRDPSSRGDCLHVAQDSPVHGQDFRRPWPGAQAGPGPSTQGGSWSWKQVDPLPPARSAHRCVHPSRRSILALEGKSCDSSLLGERLSGAHSHQPHLCPAPHPQLSCRGSRVWGLQPREGAIIQQVGTSQLQLLPSVWPELRYL